MFFKSIELSKTHWSVKLLKWMFPSLPKFYNFCPHFWLTNLALILSPFKLLFVSFIWLFSIITIPFEILSAKLEKWKEASENKVVEKICNSISKEELHTLAYFYRSAYGDRKLSDYDVADLDHCVAKHLQRYYNKLVKTFRGRKIFNEILHYQNSVYDDYITFFENNQKTYSSKESVSMKVKPWFPKAIKIAKILVGILCVPLLYIVYKLVYWFFLLLGWVWYWIVYAFYHWNWIEIGKFAIITLISIGLVIGVCFLFAYIVSILRRKNFSNFADRVCRFFSRLGKVFYAIGKGIKWIWITIKSFFLFFWEIIKYFKANNCPEIIWKD